MDEINFFSKWLYRGEGNNTLVLSNPRSKKILRLQKTPVRKAKEPNSVDNSVDNSAHKSYQTAQKKLEEEIKICRKVFMQLLGEEYVQPGTVVELPNNFMSSIKDLVTSFNEDRPNFRACKEVSSNCGYGVLMRDLCFVSGDIHDDIALERRVPTFCVEIKPKCGILPVCVKLERNAYSKIKQSICKYCLFQWMKVEREGKYSRRSGYCPLDLFSKDLNRVWYALICLLKDPQNNLRIFCDGRLVYSGEHMVPTVPLVPPYGHHQLDVEGGHARYNEQIDEDATSSQDKHLAELDDLLKPFFAISTADNLPVPMTNLNGNILPSTTQFMAIVLQLLAHDSNKTTNESYVLTTDHSVCKASRYSDAEHLTSIPEQLIAKDLSFGKVGILNKILEVQKLDQLGTDGIFKVYNDFCADEHQDALSWTQLLFDFCNHGTSYKDNGHHTNTESSLIDKLNHILKFLVAASANDCSVMIAFHKVDILGDSTDLIKDIFTGVYYKYSIGVVDLDSKECTRIPKYYHEYHDIVDNYLHYQQNHVE